MPVFDNRLFRVMVLVGTLAAGAAPVMAQSAPKNVGEMISRCQPIISEQYSNDDSRWGQCIAAAKSYLDALIPTLQTEAERQEVVAIAVDELVKLYEPQNCRVADTELPIAIRTASSYTEDAVQLAAIENISAAVGSCQQIATAAIPVEQTVVSPAQL